MFWRAGKAEIGDQVAILSFPSSRFFSLFSFLPVSFLSAPSFSSPHHYFSFLILSLSIFSFNIFFFFWFLSLFSYLSSLHRFFFFFTFPSPLFFSHVFFFFHFGFLSPFLHVLPFPPSSPPTRLFLNSFLSFFFFCFFSTLDFLFSSFFFFFFFIFFFSETKLAAEIGLFELSFALFHRTRTLWLERTPSKSPRKPFNREPPQLVLASSPFSGRPGGESSNRHHLEDSEEPIPKLFFPASLSSTHYSTFFFLLPTIPTLSLLPISFPFFYLAPFFFFFFPFIFFPFLLPTSRLFFFFHSSSLPFLFFFSFFCSSKHGNVWVCPFFFFFSFFPFFAP